MMSFENKGSVASTIVVSLSPDLTGNYVCSGAADEVEINLALAEANRRGGGRVLLLGGTYTLATSITFPGDDLVLQGVGRATFLDGDALLTTVHGIVIAGRDDCAIKDLSIQTQNGGGKTCHCIFVDDSTDRLLIENVVIVDSDDNGIHIEGVSQGDMRILNCNIIGADGHGVYSNMDDANAVYYLEVRDCKITLVGGDAIHLEDAIECQIFDNVIVVSIGGDGVELVNSDDCQIMGNNISGTTGYDINISAASCDRTRVFDNFLAGTGTGCINDVGTDTATPFIYCRVTDPNANIGTHPAVRLEDNTDTDIYDQIHIPNEFQELVTAHVIVVTAASGDMVWTVATDWGKLCTTEAYNEASDADNGTEGLLLSDLECVDISAAFTGVAAGDLVGVNFMRDGDDGSDTIGDVVYYLGIRVRYV